jgi:hypothetical protein
VFGTTPNTGDFSTRFWAASLQTFRSRAIALRVAALYTAKGQVLHRDMEDHVVDRHTSG